MPKRFLIATLAVIAALSTCGWAADQSVRAYVNRNPVPLNQSFVYTIELKNVGMKEIKEPSFSGFKRLGPRSTSSSTQVSMGTGGSSITRVESYQYTLAPTAEGEFTIESATVVTSEGTYRTEPIAIKVTAPVAQQPQQQRRRYIDPFEEFDDFFRRQDEFRRQQRQRAEEDIQKSIFVRQKVSKNPCYMGEQLIYTFQAYTRYQFMDAKPVLPDLTVGFRTEQLPDIAPRQVELKGVPYVLHEMKLALFPTAPGKYILKDTKFVAIIDPFMGQKEFKAPSITINVQSLPNEGMPENFSGAVGKFKLFPFETSVDGLVDEPLTLRFNVTGTGNFGTVRELALELPPDIDEYESKVVESVDAAAEGIKGEKIFEYILAPRAGGEYKLPGAKLVLFNPDTKKYETLQSPPILLNIKGGRSRSVAAAPPKKGTAAELRVREIRRDINHIKASPGRVGIAAGITMTAPWYLSLHLIPLAAVVAAWRGRRRRERLEADLSLARSVRARGESDARLKKARRMMSKGDGQEFCREVYQCLSGFIADKLNVSSHGMVVENVIGNLKEMGMEEETLEKFKSCVERCNMARYAPSNMSGEEMREILADASTSLREMDRYFRKKKKK